MIHKVDFTKPFWRYLYQPLYDKVLKFALSQGDTEYAVRLRFAKLILGDPTIELLVEISESDTTHILSHCLIQILPNSDNITHYAFLEHVVTDVPPTKGNFTQECEEYINTTLKARIPTLTKIALSTSRGQYRGLERKYGFGIDRIIMSKDIKPRES